MKRSKTNIVLLEACRNNPLAQLARAMRTQGMGENNGLAQIRLKRYAWAFYGLCHATGQRCQRRLRRNSPFFAARKNPIVAPGVAVTS